jgi:hypothetical protein
MEMPQLNPFALLIYADKNIFKKWKKNSFQHNPLVDL